MDMNAAVESIYQSLFSEKEEMESLFDFLDTSTMGESIEAIINHVGQLEETVEPLQDSLTSLRDLIGSIESLDSSLSNV